MSERTLLNGEPVPEDNSHTAIDPATSMQRDYVVLSAEERAEGFVKPVRFEYRHHTCRVVTRMGVSLAETYARKPDFYSGTYCFGCRAHFPLAQFEWTDGEPMDPTMQPAWHERRKAEREEARQHRIRQLEAELTKLRAQGSE